MWTRRDIGRRSAALVLIGCAAVGISVRAAHAAPPARLVADIAESPFRGLTVVPPGTSSAVVWKGKLYYAFDDGLVGRELFVSDGTADGTQLLVDTCPGRCWGVQYEIVTTSERLFFAASDGVHGTELWVSDGTAAGTAMVEDIAPGLTRSEPSWLTAVGDEVFFVADDGVHGREVWVTDGTAAGTHPVVDARAGVEGSSPSCLTPLGTGVLFVADDGVHGFEPWVATRTGGSLIKDIEPGASSSSHPSGEFHPVFPGTADCTSFAGHAYFFATDGANGDELWRSDGTPEGTVVFDLAPGPASSRGRWLFASPDLLYLGAGSGGLIAEDQELWRSDGSLAGTFRVADIAPGAADSTPFPLGVVDGTFLFTAFTEAAGWELWKTRGDEATTEMVRDIAPGPTSAFGLFTLTSVAAVGDRLLFFADDGVHGLEPWITDGSAAGTQLLLDVAPGDTRSVLAFGFQDSDARSFGHGATFMTFTYDALGWQLWFTDGEPGGTTRVDPRGRPASSILDSLGFLATDPADLGGRLFFGAWTEESGLEPWTTAGTAATTRPLGDLAPGEADGFAHGSSPFWPVRLGDSLVFHTWLPSDDETNSVNALWLTDREGSPPVKLVSLPSIVELVAFGDRVFFSGQDGIHGSEMWSTGGTEATSALFADLVPGKEGSGAGSFTPVGDRLYFTAAVDDGTELWSLHEEVVGQVADIVPGEESSFPDDLVPYGSLLLFSAAQPGSGRELWKSDGTEGGTEMVAEVGPGPADGLRRGSGLRAPRGPIAAAGSSAYFLGNDGVHGEELWRTDATAAGTSLVRDVRPGPLGSEPRWPTAVGDRLFFTANDGTHGRELWRTDPAAGAALVADLVPGTGSSNPGDLLEVDGRLWFTAYRPDVGVELWTSDGTEAGTVLVQDVAPGPESASPGRLAVSGRRLYFFAQDGTHGFEPWALLLPGRLPKGRLTVAGDLSPGGFVTLTLVIENPPPEELVDGEGDELVLELPAVLVPLAVEATSGEARIEAGGAPLRAGWDESRASAAAAVGPEAAPTARSSAAATVGPSVVVWNGSLPPGGSATVTIAARIGLAEPGTTLSLQAVVSFDSDHDGENDESLLTDDPETTGDEQPTLLVIAAPQSVVEIPTLSQVGLLVLASLVVLAARRRLG